MPQSLFRCDIHLIFSTKNRQPLCPKEKLSELFAYLGGTINGIGCKTILVGGMPDHVHLLFGLNRTMSFSKTVEQIKIESSKWAKTHIHPLFYWQNGYGAFSVSQSMNKKVVEYIRNQEVHHRTMTFQEEFVELLKKHKVEWDERYIWD